ncbi:LrgB family protein [Thiomicrospira sp. WB1]|uniref:LrgB family protein n=1 Tax=Thiomicrospira sp. WB1 TaxID=1685380 RepID=UPI000748DC03|nr:LrgB family protein [Thiomicrospira sp. WB1]KUJ71308.1 hypothetical protein AVO41_07165 [Thiomicrospira sp. WB1]
MTETLPLQQLWVYLAATPLTGLTMTLVAYSGAVWLGQRFGSPAWLNPVLLSIVALVMFLQITDLSYSDYFAGGQFIHFLLGPATVALAIPLYQQRAHLRELWRAITFGVGIGVMFGAASAMLLAWLAGSDWSMMMTLAPKSVTAPIAMGISEQIGGVPSLTAVLVVLTGVVGALIGPWLLRWMGCRDERIQGLAIGVAAHGIGTARAFQLSPLMGAFSGLAMALSGIATAWLLPWVTYWAPVSS